MILNGKHSIFKKSCLASMVSLLCMPSAYALQQLSDDSLADTTGEGVALTLENFKMVFQGPNDLSTGSSYARGIADPGKADTGFIRIIPTGENYTNLTPERVKATIYQNSYDQKILLGRADQNMLNELGSDVLNSLFKPDDVKNYNTLYKAKYDSEYKKQYDKLKLDYTKNIDADVDAKKPTLLMDERDSYFNTNTIIKNYYTQRLAYYKRGTNRGRLTDDGTTPLTTRPLSEDPTGILKYEQKAINYATQNTYEMIELLFGSRASESNSKLLNSAFFQGLGTNFSRADLIGKTVDDFIVAEKVREHQAADLRAKYNAGQTAEDAAKQLTGPIWTAIVNAANEAALSASKTASAKQLKTKADVFIYGLALSQSDESLKTRFSNQGFSWGTSDNPWLFRAGTADVRQFTDTEKSLGYLALEAPLAKTGDSSDNNIKLGLWMDIFSRGLDTSSEVDPITGGPKSGLEVNQRLRTQIIANGLSLNGSQIRLFQTLVSDNKEYSQTLGMATLLRLNTNDDPSELSALDNDLDKRGLRISTATTQESLDIATPAMKRGELAPIFDENEGMYLYSPNINLVLGNMYQPFILGSEGNNIILEVTRIPKVPNIYNQIYQRYSDGKGGYLGGAELKGSTCNVSSCGTPITIGDQVYQGRNATHSSIAIGTVEKLPGNLLNAVREDNSTGIMFKNNAGETKNFGSVAIDGVLIQHLKIKTTGL